MTGAGRNGMPIEEGDVVYLVAVRTRGPGRADAVRRVLSVLDLARPSGETGRRVEADAYAVVTAMLLREAYSLRCNEGGPAKQVHNLNDVLMAAGFTFEEANNVVPIVTEGPAS